MTASTRTATLQTGQAAAQQSTPIHWNSLYRIAAIAVILMVALGVLDIVMSTGPDGLQVSGTFTIKDWFALLQDDPFLAVRNLGIFNVISLILSIPLITVLYGIHREINPPYATMAAVIGVVGIAVYITNNPALPLLQLSHQYAEAATDSDRTLYLAAGQALLAQAEDFTPGAFLGFLMSTLGTMTMAGVVLQGGVFNKVTGWAMGFGAAFLLIFTFGATFFPSTFDFMMIFAMVGGILSMAGNLLVARRLFQLAAS